MSGVKHTPGPWKIVRGELVGANGRRVVEYGSGCAFMCSGPDEESVANAQLRNAAPDLLEALAVLVTDCSQIWSEAEFPALKQARAAIARARGEQDGGAE